MSLIFFVDTSAYTEKHLDAIMCHESQIGGRTREEFQEMRKKMGKNLGRVPGEERFRRWSVSRPRTRYGKYFDIWRIGFSSRKTGF